MAQYQVGFVAKKEGKCAECGKSFVVGTTRIRGPYLAKDEDGELLRNEKGYPVREYYGIGCHKDKRSKAQRKKDTKNFFAKREAWKKEHSPAQETAPPAPAPAPAKKQTSKRGGKEGKPSREALLQAMKEALEQKGYKNVDINSLF